MQNPTYRRNHRYTLVEIMAAMVILLILMGFLARFLWSAQQAWSLSKSNSRIYENAQIALDLMVRDLRSAVASNVQGREIPFWVNPSYDPSNWGSQDAFCCVTATPAVNNTSDTYLNEVRYSFFTDETDSASDRRKQLYWLRRSVTSDESSAGTVNADWDFYRVTTGSAWTGGENRHPIIDGVEKFEVTALGFSHDGTGTANTLPQAVRIRLTLVDPTGLDLSTPEEMRTQICDKTRRSFTRIVFLGM